MDNEQTYDTTAMYAAAAFLATGRRFVGALAGPGGRVVFRFADPSGRLAAEERAYFDGAMPAVQPCIYVDALMRIRQAMYSTTGR